MASGSKEEVDLLAHLLDSATLGDGTNGGDVRDPLSGRISSKNGKSPRHVNPLSESSGLNSNRPQQPSWRSSTKSISAVDYKPFKARPVPKTTHQPSPPPAADKRSRLSSIQLQSSPPKLHTAARSKERLAKAHVFSEHAELVQKQKAMEFESFKRQKHEAEMARSVQQKSAASSPHKSFTPPGQKLWEASQAKLEALRLEKERERKRMAVSFRARDFKYKSPSPKKAMSTSINKRRVTVADPFELRSIARHEAYKAKLNEKIQEEKEKEQAEELKQLEFHPRPVPQTTYKYVPISKIQPNAESMRRFETLHKQRLEERKKLEREGEAEFHPRPVPKTTYEPKPIAVSPRVQESLRRALVMKEIRMEEMKKREEEKALEDAEYHYKPRPAPPTTYSPKSTETEKKALQDAVLVREKKLEEMKKQEDEECSSPDRFRSRPVPQTTYKPPSSISPRYEGSLRHIKTARQQKLEELKKKAEENEYQYKPLPLPPTTFSPHRISTKETTDKKRQRQTSPHANSEVSFKARPVPKTTYEPAVPKELTPRKDASSKSSLLAKVALATSSTNAKEKEGEIAENSVFHARPLPKTTYQPHLVSPPAKSTSKVESPKRTKIDPPPRQQDLGLQQPKSPSFRARPVPVSTYQPSSMAPKQKPTSVRSVAACSTDQPSDEEQTEAPLSPKKPAITPQEPALSSPQKPALSSPQKPALSSQQKPASAVRSPAKKAEVKAKIDSETNAYSFRARSVPKSTYQSPKKQSTFRPITRPKESPVTPKPASTLSPPKKGTTAPKVQRPVVSGSSSASSQGVKTQEQINADDAALEALLNDDEAAEITFSPVENDNDDDTNARDDPELTAILKDIDPWTAATSKHSDEGDLEAMLDD
ncbi:hypothetical protein ACA910_005942 [Epithemia clementina (nom. ined.)]